MARNGWSLATPTAVALVAATAKTVIQFAAAANLLTVLQELKISFDGISNTAVPVIVQLVRKTAAATVTSQTPVKTKDTSTALQAVGGAAACGVNASAEGTNGGLLEIWHIHPQAGAFDILPLPDGEVEMAGGGIIGVVVTAPANVNCLCTLKGEE